MYVHAKTLKNGQTIYCFTYFNDQGKRVKLKTSQHPRFTSHEEAQAWAKSQEAYKSSQKAKILKRLEWKSKYYQFDDLVIRYTAWAKTRAPNSYSSLANNLKHFVLPFFLSLKHANNVNDWHLLHAEFKDWLRGEATTANKQKKHLEVSTCNNIIRTLNSFLTFLGEYHLINQESNIKCTCFPEHLINMRDYQDVITEPEMQLVFTEMKKISIPAAEFFYVMWHTGMRFNELFSLPITSIFAGQLRGSPIDEELSSKGISYYGYIVLESQSETSDRVRNPDKSITRKPLKGRRRIDSKSSRTILIMDKVAWNILARRFKVEKAKQEKRVYGTDLINYILFDDLGWNQAQKALTLAYSNLKLKKKQYHCCRHSFVTFLVGRTKSLILVRSMTGHKANSIERYLHIFEKINLVAKQQSQEIDEIA